jgi:hypothetical protein
MDLRWDWLRDRVAQRSACLFFLIFAPSSTQPISLPRLSPSTATKNFLPFSLPTLHPYRLPPPHSFFSTIVSIFVPPILLCLCSARVFHGLDSTSRGTPTFLFSVPPPLLFFPHTYRPLTFQFQPSDFAFAIRVSSPGSSCIASSGAGVLMHSIILYS